VGLLNVEGYYKSLLLFIDKAVDEGFISPTARGFIVSATNAKQLARYLELEPPRSPQSTSFPTNPEVIGCYLRSYFPKSSMIMYELKPAIPYAKGNQTHFIGVCTPKSTVKVPTSPKVP
nr:cytokinin riboside 5'-monophosphate phosphoribohydrolase LOG7 [Tanacetum cinerariifolium]